jgi:nucleoside-diphosphate-sugar epimerase
MRTTAANGVTLNVGNDREEVAIGDLARKLLAAAGLKARVAHRAANDPIPRRCPDVSRARALLGYEPKVTLEEGLRLTLDWYARQGGLAPEAARPGS